MPLVYKNGRTPLKGDRVCRNGIAQTGVVYGLIEGDETNINVMRNNGEVQKWPAAETLAIVDYGKPEPTAAAPAAETQAAPVANEAAATLANPPQAEAAPVAAEPVATH